MRALPTVPLVLLLAKAMLFLLLLLPLLPLVLVRAPMLLLLLLLVPPWMPLLLVLALVPVRAPVLLLLLLLLLWLLLLLLLPQGASAGDEWASTLRDAACMAAWLSSLHEMAAAACVAAPAGSMMEAVGLGTDACAGAGDAFVLVVLVLVNVHRGTVHKWASGHLECGN